MPGPRTFTFLGTGTSVGVPMLGCDCAVCRSPDPHNHRYRCSVLVRTPQGRILGVAAIPHASYCVRVPVASFLAVVIASQFLSPVLWDHYALVLLLPVAWLLDRGWWWAALIPLLTSTPLLVLGIGLPVAYPVAFWTSLIAVTWEGVRARREADSGHDAALRIQPIAAA